MSGVKSALSATIVRIPMANHMRAYTEFGDGQTMNSILTQSTTLRGIWVLSLIL